MSKKAIIIGAGLGGLSSGVFLAQNGYRVTVLEQSAKAGGCLQCFHRRGVKFETGMHFIGSADEGQALRKLMRALEIDDKVELSRLDPTGYDVVSLCGKRYKFANGHDAFVNQMAEYFPQQRENLERYWRLVENVANSSSVHTLRLNQGRGSVDVESQTKPIDEVIGSVITDPLLAKVLVGNLPLYAAERGKTPFGVHAFIMDFYNQSSFRIVGGSDTVAKALQATIEKYGGEVRLKKKVASILCDDRGATAAVCDDGSEYRGDVFIASCHPLRTLEMLGDTPLIRPAYRKRLKSMGQTVGVFALYLHFKRGRVPYINHNFYAYRQDSPWGCEDYTDENWPKGYLYMHFCHEPQPVFAQAGVALSYMNMDDVRQWAGTKVGKRGRDYEQFKEAHARKVLAALEEDFPGLGDNIENYYTSTPLTYLDYTGTEDGSMYGIAKDVGAGAGGRVSHKTRIPNLLLAGQNVNSHGMLGTLVGSVVACGEILTEEKLYGYIAKANGL